MTPCELRLSPIFRDREELATSSDLGSKIKEAGDGTTQNVMDQDVSKKHQRETGLNVSDNIHVSLEGAEEMSLDIPSYRSI